LSATILPNILGQLDCEVISINNYVDQRKYSPARQEHLLEVESQQNDEIAKIVKNLNYEIGFQIESGAEKISIIDQRGTWITHHRLLSIAAKLFLETHKHLEPYKIGISILAGGEIEQIAKDYNVEIVRIKNSHSAMMVAASDEKMLFIGGSYGGFIFREFLFASDAMFSVGQVLEMLAKTGYKVSELDEILPKTIQQTKQVDVPWEKKGLVMRKAMEHSEGMKRELIEGVKIFMDDNSVLLYPDKESASFTVISDSSDLETAEKLTTKYSNLIQQWKEDM